MVACAALFAWLVPDSGLTWMAVGVAAALAVIGEFAEFAAGAAGAARLGAKRRSVVLSLVAAFVGSIAGSLLLPIPVVGTVIGALLGGAVGAWVGAYAGEVSAGTNQQQGRRIAGAAMKGRVLGTLAKLVIGAGIYVVIVFDAWN